MAEKRVFKKKSNLAGGSIKYKKWADWQVSDYVILRYQESKEDNYGKQTYIGEVIDCNFLDCDDYIGKMMGLNSSGSLISAMENVEPGQMIQVTYNGKDKLTKGKYAGKDFHNLEIDLVEEDDGKEDANDGKILGSDFDESEEADGEDFF